MLFCPAVNNNNYMNKIRTREGVVVGFLGLTMID